MERTPTTRILGAGLAALLLVACIYPSTVFGGRASKLATILISGDGVGALRIGMAADSVRSIVHVVSDSFELGDEAVAVRILRVAIQDDTVELEIWRGNVARILVSSSAFRTRTGLGVGSTLSELRGAGDLNADLVDGGYVVRSARECGIVFRLEYDVPTFVLSTGNADAHFRSVDGRVRVDRVVLGGCASRGGS